MNIGRKNRYDPDLRFGAYPTDEFVENGGLRH
jgi:hypothetical protein